MVEAHGRERKRERNKCECESVYESIKGECKVARGVRILKQVQRESEKGREVRMRVQALAT